jgi:integrase
MEPRFVLRNPKATKKTSINVILRHRYDRLKYATGLSIHPDHWDNQNQRPYINGYRGKTKEHLEFIDHWLNEFKTNIKNTLYQWQLQKKPISLDTLREQLDKDFRGYEPKKKETELLRYISHHIDTVKYVKDSNPPRLISELTKAKYRATKKHLENFEASKFDHRIYLSDVNKKFYEDFIYYLQIDCNLANNTVFRYLSATAMFMKAAADEGLISEEVAKVEGIKSYMEEVFNIALNEDELSAIIHLDLSDKPTLDLVRDYFVIGCRTAQRWGDYSTFSANNFVDEKMIHIKQRKTGTSVFIPAHTDVIRIMEKYCNNLPKCISYQNFDKYLKIIGKMAGIKGNIMKHQTKGGVMQQTVYKKFELISTHTARRTGATLMHKSGMSVKDIMSVTGHKSMKEFFKYIKLTEQEIAEHLSKQKYFSPDSNQDLSS